MAASTSPMIDFKTAFLGSVRDLLILEPKIRAVHGADRLINQADPEELVALSKCSGAIIATGRRTTPELWK